MVMAMRVSALKWGLMIVTGLALILPDAARAKDFSILWWSALKWIADESQRANMVSNRRVLARYLDSLPGYGVTFHHTVDRGDFASYMRTAGRQYDLIVLDSAIRGPAFNQADLDAFRAYYASSGRALMLDGSLTIRNARYDARTSFPGDNGALAGLLLNQVEALRKAGGGLLIGTDHAGFQVSANQVLKALLPGVQFHGTTNPSRDGAFNGKVLLNGEARVRPVDILRHWEAIPDQAEAPVGRFEDFLGNEVVLYSLVDVSDKPGGKRKRSYVSFTGKPGLERYDVDSEEAPEKPDYMPTRKSVIAE
ncbi:MAG: hypothetical protein U5K36_11550 [Roseovarius sp.]|nr:hypothetical protein [Roseovarius sp.]